jgi:multicomponent Na+:H+ antiporter subunit G
MKDPLAIAFLILGSCFVLLAALGVVRMPDLFMRMQATTKASTLGIAGILIGVAIESHELEVTARAMLTLVFVFMTTPIAAHMIARAAYHSGARLWKGTLTDEMRQDLDRPAEKQ